MQSFAFRSKPNVPANQAVNLALVGTAQEATGPGPFVRVGTAAYSCNGGADADVMNAVATLGQALATHAATVDFVSVNR